MPDEKAALKRASDKAIAEIHERLFQGELRMTKIEGNVSALGTAINENTEITRKIADSVGGIVAFSDDLASGSRLICRVAKGINFLANKKIWVPVLVCYLAIYFVTHDGQLPDWAYRLVSGLIGT